MMNRFTRELDRLYLAYPWRTSIAIAAVGFVVAVLANCFHVPIGSAR
jgi:uncharacterized membrane protein YidH (DUF202 family)